MQVITIATEGLGDRSYVVTDGDVAVVIDPQRDVDRVLAAVGPAQVGLICETHVHNDYVTGGLALARITGADYVLHRRDEVTFDRRGVDEGDVVDLGGLRVTVLASPGHTPTHLAYLVEGGEGPPALFTGGSMLYGTVGRTDLLGRHLADRLTRDQYHSVRRLAQVVPPEVTVHPTHGFGSFCASAGGGSRTSRTVADERRENLACTTADEEGFVRTVLSGLTAHPRYYAHMALLNRAGPGAPDLSTPRAAGPAELAERIARGEWVVDVRPRQDFAAAHLAGSINIDGQGALATYLGWAIPWGTPVSLVGDTTDQIAAAQRELVRIGIDRPLAMAVGGPAVFARGQATGSYRAASFADLAAAADPLVVDVRRRDEWDAGHLDGAVHRPLDALADDAGGLPGDGPVWVHCATGFRAAIGASLVARAGRAVVWVDDTVDAAAAAGLSIVR